VHLERLFLDPRVPEEVFVQVFAFWQHERDYYVWWRTPDLFSLARRDLTGIPVRSLALYTAQGQLPG
jgi:hypothetical protein